MNNSLPLTNLQMLVVDDVPDSRELVAFILEAAGAQVMAVASAQAALVAMAQQSFDLIVSDINLPQRDGYSLLSDIRRLPPDQGGQTPVIALSGNVQEEEETGPAYGFQRFLLKPLHPDHLIEVIVDLLSLPSS